MERLGISSRRERRQAVRRRQVHCSRAC
jgi:hypothetical protein